MASMQEWLVVIPDHAGALSKRLELREQHLKNVVPSVQEGRVVLGGATLAAPVEEGKPPQMTGSAMIVKAESREALLETMRNDIYATGGAWDVENAQIWPFRTAVVAPSKS